MAVKNYLIEGVSGAGKSAICKELKRLGYSVIDGDEELAYNGNPETGAPIDGFGHETHIWDVDKVHALIKDKSKDKLFFCGGSRNFNKFIDQLDEIFVLDVDDQTIVERLASRDQPDGWGKNPSEVALVLRLNKTKEDIPNKAIVIDATKPLETVVDEILKRT